MSTRQPINIRNNPAMQRRSLASKLPFFYGWIIVAVAFVTSGVGVNARTSFSLMFPGVLRDFGWSGTVTAGAFSFGFLVAAALGPLLGWIVERMGPHVAMELGVLLMAGGLILAPLATQPWHIYLTLGVLVASGSVCLGYTGQGIVLPPWFARRRGLAMSLAFSGVGVCSLIMMPWLQSIIARLGWRAASWRLGLLVLIVLAPLNLLLRRRPEDLGLAPDGDTSAHPARAGVAAGLTDGWTLRRALSTARFWWLAAGYFSATFVWYAVQVHQSKFLLDLGFPTHEAAWALGFVSFAGVPGQIALGLLSDRIGRLGVWVIGNAGFIATYLALLLLRETPSPVLLWLMVGCQGLFGYGLISVLGAIPAELFPGPRAGTIFGSVMFAAAIGGAAGPWLTGAIHDRFDSYTPAFWFGIALSVFAVVAVWRAARLSRREIVRSAIVGVVA
jgi:MFS family permease